MAIRGSPDGTVAKIFNEIDDAKKQKVDCETTLPKQMLDAKNFMLDDETN